LLSGRGSRGKGGCGGEKRRKQKVANAVRTHGSDFLEMSVMTRLIPAQCVQNLLRREIHESSFEFKHTKANPVPPREREIVAGACFFPGLGGGVAAEVNAYDRTGSVPWLRTARPEAWPEGSCEP